VCSSDLDSFKKVKKVINDFAFLPEEKAREKYHLGKDSQDWKISLAQKDIKDTNIDTNLIKPILYRPFDVKYTYYTGNSSGFICRSRNEVMQNMLLGENLGLILNRQVRINYSHVFITQSLVDFHTLETANANPYLFPLYIYAYEDKQNIFTTAKKEANFSPEFIKDITNKLGYTPSPEMIFYYIYAVLHSPNYRQRYAQFLKIDFPRIPLTYNHELFKQLAEKGEILVHLHLMKKLPDIKTTMSNFISNDNLPIFTQEKGEFHYQGDGKNEVTQVKYDENKQQIMINKDCYFCDVNKSLWEFKIGGYQVLEKWLKDRQKANLTLTEKDIIHYQNILIVLQKTLEVMREIDDIYKL